MTWPRSLRKARTADSQRQWLLWTCGGALLAGILLGVFAIAPLLRLSETNHIKSQKYFAPIDSARTFVRVRSHAQRHASMRRLEMHR